MLETIDIMKSSIDVCIEHRKEKQTLLNFLSVLVSSATKSRNIELQMCALKLYGKLLLMYSEMYKTISTFKQIKRLAD